jgi:hypothetical protein
MGGFVRKGKVCATSVFDEGFQRHRCDYENLCDKNSRYSIASSFSVKIGIYLFFDRMICWYIEQC